MQKIIEFEDKVALYHNSNIPDINKVNDTDMNEIKSVVNGSLQGTNAMGSIVVDDVNCKNLFVKGANIVTPGYLDASGNVVTTHATLSYQNKLIPVQPSTQYTVSSNTSTIYRIAEYDTNGAFISRNYGTANTSYTFTTGANTYFIKMAGTLTTVLDSLQIEEGSTATEYVEGKKIIKEENGYVKEDTTFYANDFKCKNLFDKSNIVAGYLSNAGNVVSNTQYSTSNYINVKGIGNITISGSSGNNENICFYDSSQTFISFISTGTNATLTTSVPSNAYYCRITVKNTNLDLVQLEPGSEATPYTPYKNFDNTKVVLYSNTSGSTASSIDMNDDITKYTYIDVFYKSDGIWNTTRVYANQGNAFELDGIAGSSSSIWEKFSIYQIATNKLNLLHSWKRDTNMNANTFTTAYSNSTSYIAIAEVIGYK